ncbi:MAG: LysE family translocator [Alphaproteobacteria bacterium]|nr:LysE family translocator [Alphaproteobacteria bacterium]
MYEAFFPIAAVLAALLLGAMSPGPSLIYVAQKAAKVGRGTAMMTAVGMGVGGMLFAILSLLGLSAVLALAPKVFFVVRILGVIYLAYLAIKIWKHAADPFNFTANTHAATKSYGVLGGLAIQIANPKTIIVYSSVFVAALPNGTDLGLGVFLVCMIFLIEFGWYAFVGLVFSSPAARATYAGAKKGVDRTAALAMSGLAGKVAWDAFKSLGVQEG